jgi:hypothetical protein
LANSEIRNVRLRDNFDPNDFKGEGDEFRVVSGKANDRRLVWTHVIDRLAATGSTTVTYTLQVLQPVGSVTLSAVSASVNGELLGVSNRIWLPPPSRK